MQVPPDGDGLQANAHNGETDWRVRERIRDLFARYAWSFDTGDVDAYVATFLDDGTLDLPDGQFVGHAQIRAYAEGVVADAKFVGRQHFVGQSVYAATERGYVVRSYAMITQVVPSAAPALVSVGHYHDECIQSASGWRFARRTYRRWGGDILRRFQTQ